MNNMNISDQRRPHAGPTPAQHTDPKIEKSLFFQHLELLAEPCSGFNKIA